MIPRLAAIFFFCATAFAGNDWREAWDPESIQRWRARSMAEIRREADSGNGMAMWVLASRFGRDEQDEAEKWRDKAAATGLPQALRHKSALLTHTDFPGALALLEKAAASGYPQAKTDLALLLHTGRADANGFAVKADRVRAVQLLQEAADERSITAWYELAMLYTCGVGEPRNEADSPVTLFTRAANNGHTGAMLELARRRRYGYGVDKDLLSSATWTVRASLASGEPDLSGADDDHWTWMKETPEKQILLHLLDLYQKALRQRSAKALLELASLAATGRHGAPNLPRAAALYTLAERAGDTAAAAKRREVESKFNAEERQQLESELKWMSR